LRKRLLQIRSSAALLNDLAVLHGRLKSLAFKEKFDRPNAVGRSTIFQAAV